jgi:DNA end-binding protein Ku
MAARAYWQGQIRLALVSIPVEIFSATKSGAQISFKQIHEPTGQPIHYEKVVTGVGPIDVNEIVKGYEVSKGEYVLLEQDEIDAVKLESKKTLELTQFVDASEIDVLYYEKPYFVVPADDLAEEAFIVLREALRRTGKVGLGQLAMRGREYVVSLKPCGRGMVLETLRYADEVHKAQGYFREIPEGKPDEDLLDLAEALIEKKSGPFHAQEFHDRYVDALRDLIERKRQANGEKIIEDKDAGGPAKGSNVVDLMAALKKSMEGSGKAAETAKAAATKKAPAKKAASEKPVAEKKPAAAKKRA